MTENDIYQQLAEMIDREDVVGGPVTPALLRLIKLQFTPKDADLAVKITLTGGTLDELSDRLAMDKHKLSQKLLAMADKGTIIYDPADENPVYRCVGMTAGGLTETGMWGGIRFPFSVQLGKELNQLSRDHAEGALAKLGFPFTPVWAGMLALPDDALPEENLAEAVKDAGHWSVSLCPCRTSRALVTPEDTCEHMMQTCVHTGPLSRWAVKHGMARELTYDELVELLKKCNQDGLVHTINIYGLICNCCEDCCAIFHTYKMGVPTFIPSPFVAQPDEEECTACGTCAERCPVNAIRVDEYAIVDQDKCLGCGACVPTCQTESIKLVRRPKVGE
jgi:electron transport complex protein RnfB